MTHKFKTIDISIMTEFADRGVFASSQDSLDRREGRNKRYAAGGVRQIVICFEPGEKTFDDGDVGVET